MGRKRRLTKSPKVTKSPTVRRREKILRHISKRPRVSQTPMDYTGLAHCPRCNALIRADRLSRHMHSTHGVELPSTGQPQTPQGTENRVYPCPICGVLVPVDRLPTHMDRNHANEAGLHRLGMVVDAIKDVDELHNDHTVATTQTMSFSAADRGVPAPDQVDPVLDQSSVASVVRSVIEVGDNAQNDVLSGHNFTRLRRVVAHSSEHHQPKCTENNESVPFDSDCTLPRLCLGEVRLGMSLDQWQKTERANAQHRLILSVLKWTLDHAAVSTDFNQDIDLYCYLGGRPALFEVKSLTDENEIAQCRAAVGQLYEYSFLYGVPEASLWVVLEREPTTEWLVPYLKERHAMKVLWVNDGALDGPNVAELVGATI